MYSLGSKIVLLFFWISYVNFILITHLTIITTTLRSTYCEIIHSVELIWHYFGISNDIPVYLSFSSDIMYSRPSLFLGKLIKIHLLFIKLDRLIINIIQNWDNNLLFIFLFTIPSVTLTCIHRRRRLGTYFLFSVIFLTFVLYHFILLKSYNFPNFITFIYILAVP